jgi:hypothetical protein
LRGGGGRDDVTVPVRPISSRNDISNIIRERTYVPDRKNRPYKYRGSYTVRNSLRVRAKSE